MECINLIAAVAKWQGIHLQDAVADKDYYG